MTVKELIEALQKCPKEYVVWFDNCGECFKITDFEVYEYSKTVDLLSI